MYSSRGLVVVGLQWGDEGKGKIVDVLSENFDIVVRFQGGSNAGHTVILGDETYKFRIMPTGAIRGKKVVIGNGVVIDPHVLLQEIDSLKRVGIDTDLLISDRAHLITPYHIQIDSLQETTKGDKKVGTTKRGIGPTYSDKISRIGIRLCDFIHSQNDQWKLLESMSVSRIERIHRSRMEKSGSSVRKTFTSAVEKLLPYVGDAGEYLETAMNSNLRVLFEGAQGALLDIDHGTYPYVTSSNCISAAASTGTGVSFYRLDSVLGICKAYLTRVGTGPFPTELKDATGDLMRARGKEFGTVTGRPRRCGWLDLVALRYAVRINGSQYIAIAKVDVLTGIDPLKVCVAYDIDGVETKIFPASAELLANAVPVYMEFEGWIGDLTKCESFEDLPEQLKEYMSFIEKSTGSEVVLVSVGPDRTDTIMLSEPGM
ncbi:MAG: adenylosuccinate synthase [Candidatus Thorarchaeota archaeon]